MADETYNLESLKLPKLTGRPLRWLARALEMGATRRMVLPRLLRQGGIESLRQWRLDEPPTLYPSPDESGGDEAPPAAFEERADGPFCSALQISDAYRAGDVTPTVIAERCLDAIAASDDAELPLGAFIAVDRDDVLEQAAAASERYARGETLGPLDGVPIAVKDEVDQRPYPTTVGTRFFGDAAVERDATIVARLRAAGAVLVGKTNMHEIGINPNGLNVHHGLARNPFDRTRDTGGSSSGSAAAVAAGLVPIAVGADGGGSIRIPAAQCGVVGLKATFGRISEDGAAPLTWSMGHLGPIGATVSDCAAMYAAVAGPDPLDPRTRVGPPVDLSNWETDDLRGVRLGVFRPWFEHATDDIVEANRRMLDVLVDAGATLVEIEVPELDQMRIAHAVTILSEMATSMENVREERGKLGAGVRINLAIGRSFTATDYVVAQRMKTRALAIFTEVYRAVDAVITPATGLVAPPIPAKAMPHGWSDLSTETEVMRYIVPGNFIGLPAISFPVGATDDGLPIGMQAMADHWQEALLLRIARVAERRHERAAPADLVHLLADYS